MAYIKRVGIALDILLNVLFGGIAGQTISMRAALANARGSKPACIVCAALSRLVEKDHCPKQLTQGSTQTAAALRAGLLLVLLAVGVVRLPAFIISLLF